jgi:hypothetical protein
MQKLLILVLLMLGFTACPVTPTTPKVARVEITGGTGLFTSLGQTSTFKAVAYDEQNKVMDSSFSWVSSNPNEISISPNGEARAEVELGSSTVTAEAAGIKSVPVMVVAAKPSDGAVLLSDTQILGNTEVIAQNPANPFDSSLKVKLSGVSNLVPGSLFLSSGSKALAGKVISSTPVADGLEVTFAPASIQEVFKNLKLGIKTDAKQLMLDFSKTTKPRKIERRSDGSLQLEYDVKDLEIRETQTRKEFKLGPFECEITGKADLSGGSSVTVNVDQKLNVTLDGNIKDGTVSDMVFKVEGKLTGSLFGGFKFSSSVEGSFACRAIVFYLRFPAFGPISFLIMPIIPVGLGVEVKAKITGPNAEIGIAGKASATYAEGFSYENCAFKNLSTFTIEKSLVPKMKFPKIDDLKLDASAWVHVYSGLWAGICVVLQAEVVDALLGIEATASFAFEKPQATDAGYASNYDIKFKGEVKPGKHLQNFIDKVFGKGGLNVSVSFAEKLKESPTGTAKADKTQVSAGEKVKFTTDLDPANLEFPLIGYNVAEVQIFRIRNDGPAELMSTQVASEGMRNFEWQWTPTQADVGVNDFYVYINTKGVLDGFPLEINKDTKMRVIVAGDSLVTVSITGSKSETYQAPTTGSANTNVTANWRFDPTDKASNIQLPGIVFGQPVPGSGTYYLKPSLTGSVTHKGSYSLKEDCVCEAGTIENSNSSDFSSSSVNVLESLIDVSVFVIMQPDGSYTGSIYFPNYNFSGDYSYSRIANAGCPSEPQTPVNQNLTGKLEQKPSVAAEFSGKIDLTKETLLQGTTTLTDQKVSVKTSPFGSTEVPVIITITWKLGYAASTKSSSVTTVPFVPSVMPVLSNPAQNVTTPFPWDQISPAERAARKPRC